MDEPVEQLNAVSEPPPSYANEPEGNTADEGFESDSYSCASTSLASITCEYVFEHGRRYHKYQEGRYLIPNDEPEQEREDMTHFMILELCDGKLYFAPLKN